MTYQPKLQLPRIPLPLFTLDPSQTGGRKARRGFEFQDQYTAFVLAEFFSGREDFFATRIEGVEDVEAIVRNESGWVERYYQIKSHVEGGGNSTIAGLDKEGVWTRFFWLYRMFLQQQFEVNRKLELVIVVEGDLARELIELRDRGPNSPAARGRLTTILTSAVASEMPEFPSREELVGLHIDGFISSIRFESRVGNLRERTFNRLIQSGDLSPDEAQKAVQRLLAEIQAESPKPQPTLITLQTLKEWMGIPERAVLEKKPVPDPYEVDRKDLVAAISAKLEQASALLLHGVPKVGKSHVISKLVEHTHMEQSYFWFTFSGDETDKDRLLFQLATWVGQQTSVWQVRDDIQRGRLHSPQVLDRLKKIAMSAACLVLDDCHKARDPAYLGQVAHLAMDGWTTAKIVLISEARMPELRMAGIEEMAVRGFEPREAILFLTKLGVDVTNALTELGLLCVQADGHPVLLKAIVTELPQRPSPADVTRLSNSLNSAMSVQPFLQVLSERLIKSLRTDSHRDWLVRLAAITFPFRRGLALEIARLNPKIDVSDLDWNYLASQILDQSGPDQYIVPMLLRPLLAAEGQVPNAKAILVASARHVFRNAGASKQINFWDFHGAILALVIAERYEEAAMRFSLSLASSLEVGSFELFEILFMVLNGDVVQSKLRDPFARFLLLLAEIQMRLLNETEPNYSRILEILRRIRVLPKAEITQSGFLNIRMTVHAVIATIHVRRLKDKGSFNAREGRRAFAPVQTALRIATGQKDLNFIVFLLGLYENLYSLEKEPDLELLKEAVLGSPSSLSELSGDAFVGMYAQFVISKKYADSALKLCERHSAEYLAAGRGDPFFACEHAIATILHDRFSKYEEARDRVTIACARAASLGASSDTVARTELLVADSYWAEKEYVKSAEHYKRVLPADFDDEALNQWVRERLADCLIFLGQFHQATQHLAVSIKRLHARLSPENKSKLYARLLYTYGLSGQLRKAAIAAQGLCAIARTSDSAEIDVLSATLCDWLLQYFEYSDPMIPRSSVQIRDSSALSEKYTAEQIGAWVARGPLFARALILLGMIFELLRDSVRAESLYRKSLAIFQENGKASLGTGEGLFFELRICRTQIRRKRFPQAVAFFARGVVDFFTARQKETSAFTEEAAALATFVFVEPAVASLSDSELLEWFAAVESQFKDSPRARAWILFRELELLFDRLLVQKGKSKLLEAEALAASIGDNDLLLQIRHKKLIACFEQMYSNQIVWLQDVLEHGLFLATNDAFAHSRDSFGRNLFIISNQILKGPMREVAVRISGFGDRWRQNPFLFSLLAIWIISRRDRLRIACLDQIERYLRSSGDVFSGADFAA